MDLLISFGTARVSWAYNIHRLAFLIAKVDIVSSEVPVATGPIASIA